MKNPTIKKGQAVTSKTPVQAYYSNYAGNPELVFKPGMKGIFHGFAPKVRGKNEDFAVVDYEDNGKVQRVGLDLRNLVVL